MNPARWLLQMASKASRNEVQGAESAPFAAGFEAFPLRVGVLDDRLWAGALIRGDFGDSASAAGSAR